MNILHCLLDDEVEDEWKSNVLKLQGWLGVMISWNSVGSRKKYTLLLVSVSALVTVKYLHQFLHAVKLVLVERFFLFNYTVHVFSNVSEVAPNFSIKVWKIEIRYPTKFQAVASLQFQHGYEISDINSSKAWIVNSKFFNFSKNVLLLKSNSLKLDGLPVVQAYQIFSPYLMIESSFHSLFNTLNDVPFKWGSCLFPYLSRPRIPLERLKNLNYKVKCSKANMKLSLLV